MVRQPLCNTVQASGRSSKEGLNQDSENISLEIITEKLTCKQRNVYHLSLQGIGAEKDKFHIQDVRVLIITIF